MDWPVPLPEAIGDEVADLAAFTVWEQAVERVHHPDRFGPDGARLPQPRPFDYYLGVPEPSWLGKQDTGPGGAYLSSGIPKSAARLARYRTGGERWPVASACTYAIDSGAYIALNGTNTDVPWFADPDTYGGMILRFIDNNGYPPDFCATQDWPCEPPVRAKTGFTVRQHQQFTLDSHLWLVREFPMVPWIPVLQGWEAADYLEHERMYLDAGVDLAGARRVGVGSICRRGHLPAIVEVIEQFADRGYQLHGFGIKTTALPIIGGLLRSADSMAWSFNARYSKIRLPGCTHTGNCANCYRYAVHWREQVLASMTAPKEVPTMPTTTKVDPQSMRPPAALRTGDVFVYPGRGRLTLVGYDVSASAPTVALLKVAEGPPVKIDAFDGSKVEIVSRGSVDPLFANNHKGSVHLFVPLTADPARCGECGDGDTANHGAGSGHTTVKVKKKAVSAPGPDLFTGMADFAALVSADLGLTESAGPDPEPAADTGGPAPKHERTTAEERRPAMSSTFAINQSLVDAPEFPRDLNWWRRFAPMWVQVEMLPDGTVWLTAPGSLAQAKALGRWLDGCAVGRLAAAYRRLTRAETKDVQVSTPPVAEPMMLFDMDTLGVAVDAALARQQR